MSAMIKVDKLVESQIEKLPPNSVGLLVGVVSPSTPTTTTTTTNPIIIAFISQTTEDNDDTTSSISDENSSPPPSPTNNKNKTTPTLDDVTPSLINHHFRQLVRMLPGGLQILGIFTKSTTTTSTPKENPQKLLTSLQKQMKKLKSSYNASSEFDQLFLTFSNEKKITVNKFDGNKGEFLQDKSTTASYGSFNFMKVETDFDLSGWGGQLPTTLSTTTTTSANANSSPTTAGFTTLLNQLEESLSASTIIINSKFPSNSDKYTETNKNISILVGKTPLSKPSSEKKCDFINHFHTEGIIHAIGFIAEGSTTSSAASVLKIDLMRSLTSRLEMHGESLIDEDNINEDGNNSSSNLEGTTTQAIYHEVPRRVLLKLKNSISLSDYLFPGESVQDSLTSFKEIAGIGWEIGENDVEEVEGGFDPHDLSPSFKLNSESSSLLNLPSEIITNKAEKNPRLFLFILVAFFIGFMAFLAPKFFPVRK